MGTGSACFGFGFPVGESALTFRHIWRVPLATDPRRLHLAETWFAQCGGASIRTRAFPLP